jgi:hypothetical protein
VPWLPGDRFRSYCTLFVLFLCQPC